MVTYTFRLKSRKTMGRSRLRSIANHLFRLVLKYSLVRTGRMKRGWKLKVWQNNRGFTITNKVSYAKYIEGGHAVKRPNGIVKPMINRMSTYTQGRFRISFLDYFEVERTS